jgi:hypothetical protein
MLVTTLQRIRGLIQAERALAVLLPEAERMAALNRRMATVLPARVAARCRAMALEGETLLLHCDNSAAASRVRSQAKSLAEALSTPRAPITALKVKVRADWAQAEKAEKAGLGRSALGALDQLAGDLPEGGLKEAVSRMLEHQRC